MAQNKTVETEASVPGFISKFDEARQADIHTVIRIMQEVTGLPAKMWGTAIIGFDSYHYIHDSGREGDMAKVSFSPRSSSLAFYIGTQFADYDALKESLGKHTMSGSCMHIKKLSDVNLDVLRQMITNAYAYMNEKYRP